MKYRMVVTDLDGTLLRDDKTISDYTKDAIERLRRDGIKFVLATARPVRSVKKFLLFLEYDAAIHHNGAVIRVGDEIIKKIGIEHPSETALSILNAFPAARLSVEANDMLYSNFDADDIWQGVEYVRTDDFSELKNAVADKIIVEAHSANEMNKFKKYVPSNLYLQLSENKIAMIMNVGAKKENAVKTLAERYGIEMSEIVAFGDDCNDIGMLRGCGIGTAVGNALPEVMAAADFICKDCNSDGVAEWINENYSLFK